MHEVVRTLELDPISFPSGDSLSFRIEIQRRLAEPHDFRVRVWRTELFQLTPTFPSGAAPHESTENVLVNDDSYSGEISGSSADEVLASALEALSRQFASLRR